MNIRSEAGQDKEAPRQFGIAEWYGADVTRMSPAERSHYAALALSKKTKIQPCPSRPDRMCHKSGGVCSLRRYEPGPEPGTVLLGGLATTCPSRFYDGNEIFRWIGKVMLGTTDPVILNEIPFLQKLGNEAPETHDSGAQGDDDFIGRIDHVLVHPDTGRRLEWCAIEMQAVYFSGKAMSHDFQDIRNHPED